MVNWDKNVQGAKADVRRKAFEDKQRAKEEKRLAKIEEHKARTAERQRQQLEAIVTDLKKCEEEAYLSVFDILSSSGPVSPTDPALLKFLVQHTDLSVETSVERLVDALKQVVMGDEEPLSFDDFMRLLRDNAVADSRVNYSFLEAGSGMEFIPIAEAKAHMRFLAQATLSVDFSKEKWDDILGPIARSAGETVGYQEYVRCSRALARSARLLDYLEEEALFMMQGDAEDKQILEAGSKEEKSWRNISQKVSDALAGKMPACPVIVVRKEQPDGGAKTEAAAADESAGKPGGAGGQADDDLPPIARRCALCIHVGGLCASHAKFGKKTRASAAAADSAKTLRGATPSGISTTSGSSVGVRMQMHGDGANLNQRAVDAGLQSRFRAKVIQFFRPHCPRYRLTVNMHCHEKGSVPICGPGMTLFMNWFVLLAAMGAWLSLLALIFGASPEGCQAAAATLLQDDVQHYPMWTGLSYIGSTLISFAFFVWQRKLWVLMTHDNEGDLPLQSYTVQASGFPPHATDKARLVEFFREGMRLQHLPPEMLEYISIAYAYNSEDATWVNAAIDRHLEEEERLFELRHGAEYREVPAFPETSSGTELSPSEDEADAGPLWLQLSAYFCFGTDTDWPMCKGSTVASGSELHEEVGELLEMLPNSGTVFVVLKTQAMAVAMQSYVRMPSDYEGHVIRLKLVDSAPQVVFWEKFSVTKKDQILRGAASAFIISGSVVLWFICYAPTAWVYRMSVNAEGSAFLAYVQSVMAITIMVGNMMLGLVVGNLTDWIGFKKQGPLLHARLLLLAPLMLLNVLCDMYCLVWKPSNEAFAEDSFKSHRALVEEVHQLALGLLPSYCIVPYIGEPLFSILGMLWVGIWRIRRDPRITPKQAERILQAAGTDIVNPPYCDFICTTTIIVSTFLVSPSHAHRRIFPWLLVAAGVLYVQCRFRILRWESRSFYGTRRLDDCEASLWALPLGLLAAAWERNLFETKSLIDPGISLRGSRFFILHVLMHQLFLRYVVPTLEPQMPTSLQTYAEAQRRLQGHAGLADFLNANPVEVLKSHGKPEECTGRRLTYYRMDKEHLQDRAAVMDFKGEGEYALFMNSAFAGDLSTLSHSHLFLPHRRAPSATPSSSSEASGPEGQGL